MKHFLTVILVGLSGWGIYYFSRPKEPELVVNCKVALETILRSPSTLKIVSYNLLPNKSEVLMEYDAANAFGTPIRGMVSCETSEEKPYMHSVKLGGQEVNKDQLDLINSTLIYKYVRNNRPVY